MASDSDGAQMLLFRRRGGERKGAGRPPKAARAGTPHRALPRVTRHTPVHVTMRMRDGLPSLRTKKGYRAFVAALGQAKERLGMRVVAWSLQSNHVHLIAEAQSADALSRAMTGLSTRFVRAFNKSHGRRGSALADRYFAVELRNPVRARNTLRYVLANARHHLGAAPSAGALWMDGYSSAPWFDGWADGRALAAAMRARADAVVVELGGTGPPVTAAGSWLLRVGWLRGGPLSLRDAPA